MDKYIEAFLTAWYPGEWPDDLAAGEINGENFADRTRRECREAFIAAGINKLIPPEVEEASDGTF